jgi:prepilin-type N-terminal cleavage/methylation domain-containing protein
MHREPTAVRIQRRRPGPGGGFTLVELIAVIAIAAIIAGTAVPALSSLSESRTAVAARDLVRDLSFARQRAVASGTRSWVRFDAAAETWSVLVEDPASPGRAGASVMTDPATGRSFVVALGQPPLDGVTIASATFDGGAEVGFDWLGEPLNVAETALAADGAVTLSGGAVVTVRKGTGYVSQTAP